MTGTADPEKFHQARLSASASNARRSQILKAVLHALLEEASPQAVLSRIGRHYGADLMFESADWLGFPGIATELRDSAEHHAVRRVQQTSVQISGGYVNDPANDERVLALIADQHATPRQILEMEAVVKAERLRAQQGRLHREIEVPVQRTQEVSEGWGAEHHPDYVAAILRNAPQSELAEILHRVSIEFAAPAPVDAPPVGRARQSSPPLTAARPN
ncbi:MAG: hypothetical protein M3Y33_00530 [Actinomycetota bacterium]|nr:hypothetical protein [Actinomycetota bacterium]